MSDTHNARRPTRLMPSSAPFSEGWIGAAPRHAVRSDPNLAGGKWLVFVSPDVADKTWESVRDAVEEGILSTLSLGAKVSVRKRDMESHVICIYTADCGDMASVGSCLAGLRVLGISGRLFYKTNRQTTSGTYSRNSKRASTYCSDDFEGAQQLSFVL